MDINLLFLISSCLLNKPLSLTKMYIFFHIFSVKNKVFWVNESIFLQWFTYPIKTTDIYLLYLFLCILIVFIRFLPRFLRCLQGNLVFLYRERVLKMIRHSSKQWLFTLHFLCRQKRMLWRGYVFSFIEILLAIHIYIWLWNLLFNRISDPILPLNRIRQLKERPVIQLIQISFSSLCYIFLPLMERKVVLPGSQQDNMKDRYKNWIRLDIKLQDAQSSLS